MINDTSAVGKPFVEELSPSCVRLKNLSADYYVPMFKKYSNRNIQKYFPFLIEISSEHYLRQIREHENIKNETYSFKSKPVQFPSINLPKKNYFYRSAIANSPLRDKPKLSKLPAKINVVFKNELTFEHPSPSKRSPLRNRNEAKISYKEASKMQDWALIAKPEIDELWRNMICLSNGVRSCIKKPSTYKFYVGKGNNPMLIRRLMVSRNWTQTENISEANFIWTQWKDKNVISSLSPGQDISYEINLNINPSINFPTPVKVNDNYRKVDLSDLGFYRIKSSSSYSVFKATDIIPSQLKVYNKIEFNQHLANKKGLYKNLKTYYSSIGKNIFKYHPITFHVKSVEDLEFKNFTEIFNKFQKRKNKKKLKNVWILKPGENSNRGKGIKVSKDISEIKQIVGSLDHKSSKTFILQKYIEKPYLINNRKFDIRCYSLVTSINGIIQAYFYSEGYLRTTSHEFSLKNTSNNFIHLTNDAIQKHSDDYGKFEDNNKLSYKEFQRYLDSHMPDKKVNFFITVLPQIKNIVKDTVQAVYSKIDLNKRQNCMEIFGYDFMLDHKLKPWIIEVNTNPCLELSSSYLSYLIPCMVENSFKIVLDSLFPLAPKSHSDPITENKYDLIFHSVVDGEKMKNQVITNDDNESEISDADELEEKDN